MIKFLVVDDEEGISEQLKDFLLARKYKAFAAMDSTQAIEIMKKEKPNIIILDIRLEGSSGIDLLREIKKINPKARVMMLTGYPDDRTRSMSKELGASAYLTKPYNFEEIVKVARNLIGEIMKEEGI